MDPQTIAMMGGGRPLTPNAGSAAGPPYVGPNGLDWQRPIPGGAVAFSPAAPRGQRLPSQRDEHGRAVSVVAPLAREGQYMPPGWKGQAAILGGPMSATY